MSSKQNQKTGKKALTSSKRKAAEALSQATKKAHTGTSDTSHAARPDNHPTPSACVAVEGGRGNATMHCNDAAIEVMDGTSVAAEGGGGNATTHHNDAAIKVPDGSVHSEHDLEASDAELG